MKELTPTQEEYLRLYKEFRRFEKIPVSQANKIYKAIADGKGITPRAVRKALNSKTVLPHIEEFENTYAVQEQLSKPSSGMGIDNDEINRNLEAFEILSLDYIIQPLHELYEEAKADENPDSKQKKIRELNSQILEIKKHYSIEEQDYLSTVKNFTTKKLIEEAVSVFRILLGNDRLKSILMEVMNENNQDITEVK